MESLEILHIRDNQIQSFGENFVDGCLKNLRYINLRANNVDKMEEVKKLSILPKLTELVLTDNPLVEEEDYGRFLEFYLENPAGKSCRFDSIKNPKSGFT